jgi:hypothetical protein
LLAGSLTLWAVASAAHQTVTTTDVRKLDIADLIRGCDAIIEAEVVSVRYFDLSVDSSSKSPGKLVEVRVRDVLWGEPGPSVMQVVAGPDTLIFRDFRGPRPGDVDILFIERWHELGGYDANLRARLKDAVGTSDVMQVIANGRGRLPSREESGRHVLWIPTYSIALWEPLVAAREDPEHHMDGWICTDRGEFVAGLLDSVKRLVPSVELREVQLRGGGVLSPTPLVSIDPGGRCRNFAIEHGGYSDIGTKGLTQILDVARRERFFDLPLDLGHSTDPEISVFSIRIRTEHGSRLVRLHGGVRKDGDQSTIDALDRVSRVLRAMPYSEYWRLGDH